MLSDVRCLNKIAKQLAQSNSKHWKPKNIASISEWAHPLIPAYRHPEPSQIGLLRDSLYGTAEMLATLSVYCTDKQEVFCKSTWQEKRAKLQRKRNTKGEVKEKASGVTNATSFPLGFLSFLKLTCESLMSVVAAARSTSRPPFVSADCWVLTQEERESLLLYCCAVFCNFSGCSCSH